MRSTTAVAIALLVISTDASAQERWHSLDDFLARGIGLGAAQLAALSRGEAVGKVLPTADGRDVAVFGAVNIDVSRSIFVERQREALRARRTSTRNTAQIFSNPATVADVQSLELTADDLKELDACRPTSCNFKLPATDMERLHATIKSSESDAHARVVAYVRQRMVDYVTDYRRRGNAAMLVYDDAARSLRASDALATMLEDSSYAFRVVPSVGRSLVNYPRDPVPGATNVILWSIDELPRLRPILRITHASVYSPPEVPGTTVLVAKQIYANHYFEAGLEALTVVDRAAADVPTKGGGISVIAVRRYRFDHLPSGGLLNVRGRAISGLQDNVLADLRRFKHDAETASASVGR